MAAIYANDSKHIVLTSLEGKEKVDFVQHKGKKVELLSMDKEKFSREFSLVTTKHTAQTFAQKFLDLAKTGVVITPAAAFALKQITKEDAMAIPTTLPKNNGKAAKKDAPEKPKKLSEHTVDAPAAEAEAPAKPKRTAKAEPEKAEKPKRVSKPRAKKEDTDAPWSDSDIVAEANAEAARIIAEADEKLETAKLRAEEKKASTAAKSEARKIIAAAKKHAAKVKTQIAKMFGRGSRKSEEDGEEKPKRASKPRAPKADAEEADDLTGKKIVQVNEPKVREGSAAGARALAVYKSKSVKSALQYEGVTPRLVRQMVENGFIELV